MKEIPQVPLRGATVYTDWEGPRTHADNTRFADPHACWNAPASLIHHRVSLPRGGTLDAERPFVRRDAEGPKVMPRLYIATRTQSGVRSGCVVYTP